MVVRGAFILVPPPAGALKSWVWDFECFTGHDSLAPALPRYLHWTPPGEAPEARAPLVLRTSAVNPA